VGHLIAPGDIEDLLRSLAPQVLGALVRRFDDFDICEDAVQEALLAAALQWPADGVPANPRGWLTVVASRRRTEMWRSESARRRREEAALASLPPDIEHPSATDDSLELLLLCCHPSLTPMSQVALTLRAVGGLTTGEIARALLVPEATVAQRISRAKLRIRASGAHFRLPPDAERSERLPAVLRVLYLIFNEGSTASSGATLHRIDLIAEAIRLTRLLHERLPEDGEVSGLLALMLLTDARRPARVDADGALVPLADQDRRLWDPQFIAEGIELITRALAVAPIGPYQLQAALAALHDEAARAEDTDWPQILVLYELLRTIAPGPMVTLNRIVAVAMVHGPEAALSELAAIENDPALTGNHRVNAVRAHLFEMSGDTIAARDQYRLAARRTLSIPEQRYLTSRAASLSAGNS
jgi:RNA polymerase sigma factor (sigma-70 family)